MKQLVLMLALSLTAGTALFAQGGGFQRRTVAERVQIAHSKIDSTFKFDAAKMTLIDTVFAVYYRATDKVREDLMSAGGERPDMQVMREKMQPAVDARDKELKTLMTEEQFKVYKDFVEPAIMPRRGQGGGGAPRQR